MASTTSPDLLRGLDSIMALPDPLTELSDACDDARTSAAAQAAYLAMCSLEQQRRFGKLRVRQAAAEEADYVATAEGRPWVGVVGLGQVGMAVLELLGGACEVPTAKLAVCARDRGALAEAAARGLTHCHASFAPLARCRVVVVAVSPAHAAAVAAAAAGPLAEAAARGRAPLVVSLVAGMPQRKVAQLFRTAHCVCSCVEPQALPHPWTYGGGDGDDAPERGAGAFALAAAQMCSDERRLAETAAALENHALATLGADAAAGALKGLLGTFGGGGAADDDALDGYRRAAAAAHPVFGASGVAASLVALRVAGDADTDKAALLEEAGMNGAW